jgi:superoxide reductase
MSEKNLGHLIYSADNAPGEAAGKKENHIPKIEAPASVKAGEAFEVKVVVGPHPNTNEHSIRWVAVFLEEEGRAFNPIMLAKSSFAPVYGSPEVIFKLQLQKGGVLHASEYCSLHGLWSGKKEIKVT